MNRQSEQNPAICNLDPSYARRARLTTEVLLQGKWRIEILCVLRQGSIRLGQLARLILAASKKMLTENLRKLEAYGIVIPNDLSDTTLHVEYDLNDSARERLRALGRTYKIGDLLVFRSSNVSSTPIKET